MWSIRFDRRASTYSSHVEGFELVDWSRRLSNKKDNRSPLCYPCNPFASIVCHDFQIPKFLRIVPSPLQGTSQRILSNNKGSRREPSVDRAGTLIVGKLDASRLVTMRAGLGSRAVWWISKWVRLLSLSFARRSPEGTEVEVIVSWAWSASKIWAVYNHAVVIEEKE